MTYLPSTYTEADRNAITSSYGTLEEVALALENHDESVVPVEDLFAYYIEMAGALPEFMTGSLLSPDDPELQALWADPELVQAVDDVRTLNAGNESLEGLIIQLEAFLDTGGVEYSVFEDAVDFVEAYDAAHAADGEEGEGSDEEGVLLTNMMSIAMRWGNPGLAILFYIMGSETEYEVPAEAGDVDESTGIVELNPDGTSVTIHTESGDIQADLGETVNFVHTGFGQIVNDFQVEVLDQIESVQQDIEDTREGLQDIDYEDPVEANYEPQVIKDQIAAMQNVSEIYSELLKMSQEMLESLVQSATSLLDLKFQTERSIFR